MGNSTEYIAELASEQIVELKTRVEELDRWLRKCSSAAGYELDDGEFDLSGVDLIVRERVAKLMRDGQEAFAVRDACNVKIENLEGELAEMTEIAQDLQLIILNDVPSAAIQLTTANAKVAELEDELSKWPATDDGRLTDNDLDAICHYVAHLDGGTVVEQVAAAVGMKHQQRGASSTVSVPVLPTDAGDEALVDGLVRRREAERGEEVARQADILSRIQPGLTAPKDGREFTGLHAHVTRYDVDLQQWKAGEPMGWIPEDEPNQRKGKP